MAFALYDMLIVMLPGTVLKPLYCPTLFVVLISQFHKLMLVNKLQFLLKPQALKYVKRLLKFFFLFLFVVLQ